MGGFGGGWEGVGGEGVGRKLFYWTGLWFFGGCNTPRFCCGGGAAVQHVCGGVATRCNTMQQAATVGGSNKAQGKGDKWRLVGGGCAREGARGVAREGAGTARNGTRGLLLLG